MCRGYAAQTMDSEQHIRAGFASTLRRLRRDAGLTREQLCERCPGLKGAYLAKLEQGQRFPSDKLLAQIATALDTDTRSLLEAAERYGSTLMDSDPRAASTAPTMAAQRSLAAAVADRPSTQPEIGPTRYTPRWLTDLESTLEPAVRRGDYRLIGELERVARLLIDVEVSPEQWDALRQIMHRLLSDQPEHLTRARRLVEVCTAYLSATARHDEQEFTRLLDMAHTLIRGEHTPLPRVAAIPPDTVHFVWRTTVGIAADGILWLDPLAPAHRAGLAESDPRIRRLPDGRVQLDISSLEDTDIEPRDPDRHRQQALVVRGIAGDQLPLAAYEATILQIRWDNATTIEVAPVAHGVTDGTFPASHRSIHVVTAHNPAPLVLPPEENAQRNEQLLADIKAHAYTWRPASGISPDPAEPWEEHSFALLDVDRADAVDLARAYDQAAVFEWTPEHRATVLCHRADTPHDEAVIPTGWSARWL